jgi:hypothetical protein
MKKKRPIPPKKKICGLVPEFAARWQLIRTYSLTPTSNNYMKHEAQQQQYIERTRITLKKNPAIKNTKSKTVKTPHQLRKIKTWTYCPLCCA